MLIVNTPHNANVTGMDWAVGEQLTLSQDKKFWENDTGRDVRVLVSGIQTGASALGITNSAVISFIPNLSSDSAFDVNLDLLFSIESFEAIRPTGVTWDNFQMFTTKPIPVPDGKFLHITAHSTKISDGNVKLDANETKLWDVDSGHDVKFIGTKPVVLSADDFLKVDVFSVAENTPLSSAFTFLSNVVQISGDSSAANNLELQYDETGLSGDTFPATQSQVGNLSTGSAAISTTVSSTEATTPAVVGNPTNDFTETVQQDAIYHSWTPAGGELEFAYNFNIGPNASPVDAVWVGFCQSINDEVAVFARNWVGASWEQVGTIIGTALATTQMEAFSLTTAHVNTGANSGDVRVRFVSTGGTIMTTLATDRMLLSYTITNQSVGYANGAVWVDTNLSNTNTVDFVDGTADNPVSTWQAANTIATSIGIKRFDIINGSTITLTAGDPGTNISLFGAHWTLVLDGQTIGGMHTNGASVSGISTGSGYDFHDCTIGSGTFDDGDFLNCAIAGDLVLAGAGTYFFDACFSGVAGTDTPSMDLENANESKNLNLRHYSGGIELKNFGHGTADHNASIEGHGQIVINANSSNANAGDSLAVRGHFPITDNVNPWGGTISDDARFTRSELVDEVWDEDVSKSEHNVSQSAAKKLRESDISITADTAQGPGTGNNQIQLATGASSTDGAYDPARVFIKDGTGAGQSRNILQYEGSTRTATVDRNWKTTPSNDSEYVVLADAGREHINEGLAQAGSINTITLNALASSASNTYKNQFVFLRSGTGEDQVRRINNYVGSTRVATVSDDWTVTPDSTTAYAMLPFSCTETQAISGTEITSSAGSNFETFFNNSDAITIIVVDDVGDGTAANQATILARFDSAMNTAGTAGGFSSTTDSLQSVRDNQDTIGGGGPSLGD